MKKMFTCILCPNGCQVAVEYEGEPAKILSVRGNLCGKGEAYAKQELLAPLRSIASVVKVEGGELPLASVRLSRPIPKNRIFPVMEEIRRQCLQAPVSIGQVVIADVLGLGSDVIVTKNVASR